MPANNNNANEKLAKELGYQNSLKTWVAYDDELLSKPDSELTWYDKATLNMNPNLKSNREAYQSSLNRSNQLRDRLTNIESARQYLQNNVSQQRDRINKLYDLQDRAAAISASIQWTNRAAWWLWAASNVLWNSRWITDAQMQQQILQNDAQRESALANVAQQEANIPSVLASLDQANANSELARAQANYYNQSSNQWWSSSSGWIRRSNSNNNNNNNNNNNYSFIDWVDMNWQHFDWTFIKDKDWNIYNEEWKLLSYKDENWNTKYTKDWQAMFKLDEVNTDNKTNELVGKKFTDDMNPTNFLPRLSL